MPTTTNMVAMLMSGAGEEEEEEEEEPQLETVMIQHTGVVNRLRVYIYCVVGYSRTSC